MADGASAAEKWKANMATAGPRYAKGVQTTSKDPAQAAIRAKPAMEQNTMRAIQDGTWEAGLNRSGKAGWQKGCMEKGQSRLQSGAQAAAQKVAAYLGATVPLQQQAAQSIKDSIPKMNDDGALARVRAMMEQNRSIAKANKPR